MNAKGERMTIHRKPTYDQPVYPHAVPPAATGRVHTHYKTKMDEIEEALSAQPPMTTARDCWRAAWWVMSRTAAFLLLYYFIVYAIEAM